MFWKEDGPSNPRASFYPFAAWIEQGELEEQARTTGRKPNMLPKCRETLIEKARTEELSR